MKSNKTFLTFVFLQIISVQFCFSQFIIAGQVSTADYYYDFNPDIELYAYLQHYPGDTNAVAYLDLDLDGRTDFTLYASGGIGTSHSIFTTVIYPNDSNQVAYSRFEDAYNPCCGTSTRINVARIYNQGDTISSGVSFTDNVERALNYDYSLFGFGSFAIHDWTQAGEKYLGFRLINSIDTSYGWMRIYAPASAHSFTRDYAINNNRGVRVEEINRQSRYLIYPNPATTKLQIKTSANCKNLKTEIYSTLGEKLFQKEFKVASSSFQIDVSNFNEGIYFLHLTTEVESFTQKIIIQK